ncbi:hypothetical protein CDAR_447231 [Caerostris darwini]|uniref:Uncharacterized protein n=1 Tax=Caerostris darwini TaxID=1538125 RepID=A0AAV4PSP3_9ARAC|nr:hypothetical protein CDAR_447231 [Caerostris darwini]
MYERQKLGSFNERKAKTCASNERKIKASALSNTLTTNKYLDTYANDDICGPEVRHGLRRYISCVQILIGNQCSMGSRRKGNTSAPDEQKAKTLLMKDRQRLNVANTQKAMTSLANG